MPRRLYKHTAPLGQADWDSSLYKHTAPVGQADWDSAFYKHAGPLGQVSSLAVFARVTFNCCRSVRKSRAKKSCPIPVKNRNALNEIRALRQGLIKLDMTPSAVLIYLFPFFTGVTVGVCSKRYQTS